MRSGPNGRRSPIGDFGIERLRSEYTISVKLVSKDNRQVVCVKFSKKILGMWAQVKPWARSGALGESSAERPQRVKQLAAS